ncbi:MAG: hypothetical protein KDB53_07725 [Planctomycetes bacterium]|nr:hypothetical protein [Planctomycetota bacterium]
MTIQCPQCGGSARESDITGNGRVDCRWCDSTYRLPPSERAAHPDAPAEPDKPRIAPALPDRMTIEHHPGGLLITTRPNRIAAIFMTVFCLFWNGFLVFWFTFTLKHGLGLMAAFGTLHAIVGLLLIWITLAVWLNHTEIRVGNGALTVRHQPIPVPGNTTTPLHQVKQLYCQRQVRQQENGQSVSWSVHAVDSEGRRRPVLKNLPDEDQALFIEAEVERFLEHS